MAVAHPPLGFFYAQGTAPDRRGFAYLTLKRDLERGVHRLPDYAYMRHWGSSRASLHFALHLRNILGHLFQGKQATMTYRNGDYRLSVITVGNLEIVYTGVGSGYFGEGSRTAYDILKLMGFPEKKLEKIWTQENFRITVGGGRRGKAG